MPGMEIYLPEQESFLTLNVFAYMLYPKDQAAREAWLAHKIGEIVLAHAQQSGNEEVTLPIGLMEIILKTRGTCIHEVQSDVVLSGSVAGRILLALVEMHVDGVEPSVNKAIHLVIPFFERAVSQTGHKVTATSVRKLREAWAEYMPVAHLWGAIQLAADPLHRDHWAAAMQNDSLRVLALARDLLHAVKGITNRYIKGPILPISEMWTLPDGIELPEQQMTCTGLSDEQRERLKTYAARDMTNH